MRIRHFALGVLLLLLSSGSVFAQAARMNTTTGIMYVRSLDRLFISQGTVTVNTNPTINATVTWNEGSTAFTGFKLTITDTASAAGSLAVNILGGAAGTTTLFSVDKAGVLTTAGAGSLVFGARGSLSASADGVFVLKENDGDGFSRIAFGGTTSSYPAISRLSTALEAVLADASAWAPFRGSVLTSTDARITAGSGTGITVNQLGGIYEQNYKATIASTQFVTNGVTHDVTVATLPAKTILHAIYADLTQTFACTAVCTTATLSMTVGSSAGGNDLLTTFDVDAATLQRGLVDGDLGTGINRANAVQGGKLFSWTATTPVSLRMTSGTGALGDGTATNLSQGSITVYLITTRLP